MGIFMSIYQRRELILIFRITDGTEYYECQKTHYLKCDDKEDISNPKSLRPSLLRDHNHLSPLSRVR